MTNGTKNIFHYLNTLVDLTLIILFSNILKFFKKELFQRTIFLQETRESMGSLFRACNLRNLLNVQRKCVEATPTL